MIPSRNVIRDFSIDPLVLGDIVDKHISVLGVIRPSSVDQKLVIWQHGGTVSTTSIGEFTARVQFIPFKGFNINGIKIIESSALITNTTMTTENIDFSIVISKSVISSRFRSANFGFSVFRFSSRFLIRRLTPFPIAYTRVVREGF